MVGERVHTKEHMQHDPIYLKFTNGYSQVMALNVRTVVILAGMTGRAWEGGLWNTANALLITWA